MSKYRICDVMWELAEFSKDLLSDLRQQLHYHRASVYKTETAKELNLHVEQLRALCAIMGDDILNEMMADFDAVARSCGQMSAAGECTLTTRITRLISDAEPALNQFQKRVARNRSVLGQEQLQAIAAKRRALLSVCRQGTRSWELLKNL